MTADEFERAYAARSGITVEALRAAGKVVRPCDCGDDGCEGWQSLGPDAAADYDALERIPAAWIDAARRLGFYRDR
jgi:hypothetical protein